MRCQQAGFTLIELVMVIVILGILAATAVPKFVDLSSDARVSAVEGFASALGSASSINYAARRLNASAGVAIANCTDVANALENGLDSDFEIVGQGLNDGQIRTNCRVRMKWPYISVFALFAGRGID